MLNWLYSFTEEIGYISLKALGGILRFISIPFVLLYKLFVLLVRFSFRAFIYFICPAQIDRKSYLKKVKKAIRELKETLHGDPYNLIPLLMYFIKVNNSLYRFKFRYFLYWILPVCSTVLVAVLSFSYFDKTLALTVTQNGNTIGYVRSEEDLLEATAEATERLSLANNYSNVGKNLKYTFTLTDFDSIDSISSLRDAIIANSGINTEYACGVYIDGNLFSVCKSSSFAKECFDSILATKAVDSNVYLTCFVEDIKYEDGVYPSSAVLSDDEFESLLKEKSDTVLSLKVLKTEVKTVTVDFDTVEVPSNMLYVGSSRTLSSGTEGVDQVTNLVTYIDSEIVETNEISRITLKESVSERIQTGTKELDAAYSATSMGGIFLWPIDGAYGVNSDYGYRWGRLHQGIDLGMGGAAGTSLGKNVIAVADGVVTTATYHYLYGYYIIIDHGNGLSTLYAHLYPDSFTIAAGDTVVAGQPIAKVGSSGNSTGPHLHFEVRVNGNKVNPRPYLGI